jgi:hypothetical protein
MSQSEANPFEGHAGKLSEHLIWPSVRKLVLKSFE